MEFVQILAMFGFIWMLLAAAGVCWITLLVLTASRDKNKNKKG